METSKDDFQSRVNESKVRQIVKSKLGKDPSFSSFSGFTKSDGKKDKLGFTSKGHAEKKEKHFM